MSSKSTEPRGLCQVRSILSVPAHDARKVAGARARGADLLMWDLEDSVPSAAKAEALARIVEVAQPGDAVRLSSSRGHEEITRLADRGLVFVIPKVDSYITLFTLHRVAFGVPLVALVEAPAAIACLAEIVAEAGRDRIRYGMHLDGIAFGRWDFEAAIGHPCPALVDHARAQVVLHARAAGIACWDAPALLHETVMEAEAAYALGFTGKGCVHPAQVAGVHVAWEPRADWQPLPFAVQGAAA